MNLATIVALPAQESKLTDVVAVANCVGSGQNGKTGTTLPESEDNLGKRSRHGKPLIRHSTPRGSRRR